MGSDEAWILIQMRQQFVLQPICQSASKAASTFGVDDVLMINIPQLRQVPNDVPHESWCWREGDLHVRQSVMQARSAAREGVAGQLHKEIVCLRGAVMQ